MKVILSRKCFDSTAGISKPTTFIAILILITLALLSAVCGMRLYGDIEKETCFGLGCDPGDVAADGMVCHNGGSYYVANKPTNGCITKIDGKGRKIIVYRNGVPSVFDVKKNSWSIKLNPGEGVYVIPYKE
jgi:hypothetical protein